MDNELVQAEPQDCDEQAEPRDCDFLKSDQEVWYVLVVDNIYSTSIEAMNGYEHALSIDFNNI